MPTRSQIRNCIQTGLPVLLLVTCVCGVLLILGFISGGVLAGMAVIIPVVVLGALSSFGIITGTIMAAGGCWSRSTEDPEESHILSIPALTTRPSRATVRRRMEIVGTLPHSEQALLELPPDERACSICLTETPYERVILNCGHMFHDSCVNQWVSRARFARCPLCRTGITPNPQQPAGDLTPVSRDERMQSSMFSPSICSNV